MIGFDFVAFVRPSCDCLPALHWFVAGGGTQGRLAATSKLTEGCPRIAILFELAGGL